MRATALPTVPNPRMATFSVAAGTPEARSRAEGAAMVFLQSLEGADPLCLHRERSGRGLTGALFKDVAVQVLYRLYRILFLHDKADADLRRTLGDHVDVDAGGRDDAEDLRGDAHAAANVFADQADNRHLGLELDLAQRLQLAGQLAQLAVAFHGHRGGGAGDGDDFAGQMVPAQQAEQIVQEVQGTDMARRADVEDRDVALEGNGAEVRGAVNGGAADDGALLFRLVGVEHSHGNVMLHGRQKGRRMQYLGAEAGQLGGLMEADLGDALRLGAHARIGGENAADVGPDLNARGVQGGADDGRRVVRAAASQGGDLAAFAGGDEAAEHRNQVLLEQRRNGLLEPGADGRGQRGGRRVFGVGNDELAGIGVGCGEAEGVEGSRHKLA